MVDLWWVFGLCVLVSLFWGFGGGILFGVICGLFVGWLVCCGLLVVIWLLAQFRFAVARLLFRCFCCLWLIVVLFSGVVNSVVCSWYWVDFDLNLICWFAGG